jgi:plastocyanin
LKLVGGHASFVRLRPAAAALALLASLFPMAGPTAAATTLTISAGAQSPGKDVQLNVFAPGTTTINVGDTITWRLDSTEFHTVTFLAGQPEPEFVTPGPDGAFLNPAAVLPAGGNTYDGSAYTNSGLMMLGGPGSEPPTYSLTFTKPGTYDYVCIVHPGMQGKVVVNPEGQSAGAPQVGSPQAGAPQAGTPQAGTPRADTQSTVDARSRDEVNALLAGDGISTIMSNAGELPADGATAGLAMGAGTAQVDVQRFFPPRVTIHAGDSLTWINKSEAPHTVTFLAGQPQPDVVNVMPQPDGPPRFQLNPTMFNPAGDPSAYDGSSYLNSGFTEPGPNGTYTVTFTQPGSYDYVCLLHPGMTGTVVVQ